MLLNRAYYFLKPVLPWKMRVALRRNRAAKQRKMFQEVWPIDPHAGAAPPRWPGWPNGRKFAFVLTHDVEGQKGLSRVPQVMEIESRLGFRSSFNFVAEGEYRLPDELREALKAGNFDIGVHGLKHDGKMYQSKKRFASEAVRIREYLAKWNATGFRSPLMQHRLDWLHALGTEYDCSTFDSDPFEPEADGMRTIFPFWVPGEDGKGFVELPYTLSQDFTLFVVLRESNIEIWKQKLDWIVERGGMALLNTHPDYMCFSGSACRDEYPIAYYREFLEHVRSKYRGQYWAALPGEVARYYTAKLPLGQRNTRKKICMLAYTAYECDNRVRRYAEALAKRGDQVDVVALSSKAFRQPKSEVEGVTVYRVQHRDFNERNKWSYALRLLRFLWRSSQTLVSLQKQQRYDLIHIHNMPDFLAFAAWYPKLDGAKLILDIHDIVPEFFKCKFDTKLADVYVGLLKRIERLSGQFVDHVIVSNHLWLETLVNRSISREKCSVILNHVDQEVFYRRPRRRNDGRIVVIFPGSFQWHQGLDIAIEAFKEFRKQIPNAEFHLYGGSGGDQEAELKKLAERLELNGSVKFCEGIALERVPDVIANADLGIVPKRANSFGNEAYSTKIMEFMSQGVPVVVSKTKIDSYYFEEGVVHFFPSGDSQALAQAMLEVIENQNLREGLIKRGIEYVERNGWEHKKGEYLALVDALSTERFKMTDQKRDL